jgi:hypothetical protein
MREDGAVFNDKHLSYDTKLATEMVAASRDSSSGSWPGRPCR